MIPGLDVSVPTFVKTAPKGLGPPVIEFEVLREYRGETLSMMCRYSALRHLMDQLKHSKDLQMIKCPFPPKMLNLPFTSLPDDKLQERCGMLDAFLKAVVHADLSAQGMQIVREFFKLDHLHEPSKMMSLTIPSKTTSEEAKEDTQTGTDAPNKPAYSGSTSMVYE